MFVFLCNEVLYSVYMDYNRKERALVQMYWWATWYQLSSGLNVHHFSEVFLYILNPVITDSFLKTPIVNYLSTSHHYINSASLQTGRLPILGLLWLPYTLAGYS